MSSADAQKWDERYRTGAEAGFERPRDFLIGQAQYLPQRGLALDIAMGLGGNAGFLIERGLRTIGVDVSEVGVRQAKSRLPALRAAVIDLTRYRWPDCTFDVILNFYYLQRDLWPHFWRILRPHGLVIVETLTREMLQVRPDFNPTYLLAPGELRRAFKNWELLFYREGWIDTGGHSPHAVASLVAQHP